MKRLGQGALALGVVLAAAGLVLLLFVVPSLAQFPDDVNEVRQYEGQLGVLLNPQALAENDLANLFIRDIPMTIDRQVVVLETDGSDALVSDTAVLNGPTGPLQSSADTYTIDRKTMEHIENFSANADVIDREGLVVGFPIGTEERDYVGWNGDTLETNTLTFVRAEERNGLDTLHFTASSEPRPILDPVLLATFPPALPKAVLSQLVPALGLPAEAAGQLAAVLEVMPDPVPLSYTYNYATEYWVEPNSGVLVDYTKDETRIVGLEVGGNFAPVTAVGQFTYELSDTSIVDAVADANDAKGSLLWFGKVLPWALIAGGLVLLLSGLTPILRGND